MPRYSLTYAGGRYFDRTVALETGEVRPDGIELNYVTVDTTQLFYRMARHAEFQASEMSASTYLMMRSRGDDRLIAIPVFPSRAFRHSQVYVNLNSGISRPADLVGKKVAVDEYQMTSALWIRAFLQHDYAVTPDMIDWWMGGLTTPHFEERLAHKLPRGVSLSRIPSDKSIEGMLGAGELDAFVTGAVPHLFHQPSSPIGRLFPDYRKVEEDYFHRTRLFPIMHVVVLRRDVYEAHRWVAASLLDAFERAKAAGYHRLVDLSALSIMHPWIGGEMDALRLDFGGNPFTYGFQQNLGVLEALTQYSYEQGLSVRKLDPQELFAEETLQWSPEALGLSDVNPAGG